MKIEKEYWVIMSKDNKMIAKGVPRNRYLIRIDDEKDKKRILMYNSESKAKAGYTVSWFYCSEGKYSREDMKAVKCKFILDLECDVK